MDQALSDLRCDSLLTYEEHSLNLRLDTIQNRRLNRAILRDIKTFLVFSEQLELLRFPIRFLRLLRLLVMNHYIILVVDHSLFSVSGLIT